MKIRLFFFVTGFFMCTLGFCQRLSQRKLGLIRGPYLQAAGPETITIRWRTSEALKGFVYYGETAGILCNQVADPNAVTEHKIRIQGLKPATKYYYRIGNGKQVSATSAQYFKTPPITGTKGFYRIAALGDCGDNSVNQHRNLEQLVKYLGKKYLDAWILLGDNAYPSGHDESYQQHFFNVYQKDLLAKYKLYPAPGNHDYRDGDSIIEQQSQLSHQVPYYDNFTMPVEGEGGGLPSHNPAYYSFNIGNIHFLSLDSHGMEEGQYYLYDTSGPQATWVKKDLAANQNKGWVIAYWHHPPYTMGSHNSDTEADLAAIRTQFIGILERYGVDLVLCGHSHNYERSKLMHGYYGMEADFDSCKYLLSNSSAKYNGTPNSCPYLKDSMPGTVYVVSGSTGQLGGEQPNYPHDALPFANSTIGGFSMLEIQDNRLNLKWICSDGVIRDQFTMMKYVNHRSSIRIRKGERVDLIASWTGRYIWNRFSEHTKSITVSPSVRTIYEVKDQYNCLKDLFEIVVD